jgi:hypothetical protein
MHTQNIPRSNILITQEAIIIQHTGGNYNTKSDKHTLAMDTYTDTHTQNPSVTTAYCFSAFSRHVVLSFPPMPSSCLIVLCSTFSFLDIQTRSRVHFLLLKYARAPHLLAGRRSPCEAEVRKAVRRGVKRTHGTQRQGALRLWQRLHKRHEVR